MQTKRDFACNPARCNANAIGIAWRSHANDHAAGFCPGGQGADLPGGGRGDREDSEPVPRFVTQPIMILKMLYQFAARSLIPFFRTWTDELKDKDFELEMSWICEESSAFAVP